MRSTLSTCFALVVLAGAIPAVVAEDAKPAPNPVWLREINGLDVAVELAKETMKISVYSGDNGIVVSFSYTVDKDGLVKAKVVDVEEKGSFPAKPTKGMTYSFTWKVKGEKATLEDLKGEGVEEAKTVLEGEYTKKKAK